MHAILTPVGSSGDVNPFVIIGRELSRRGHRVTVMAPDVFRDVISKAGLAFASTGTAEEFEHATRNPDLWHPRRGARVVFGEVRKYMRRSYAVLEQLYVPGDSLVVGHSLSVFTRVFEEMHSVAAATVHLAPTVFRSDYRQPILPSGHDITSWPRWAKRTLWWVIDRFGIDPLLARELNAWRQTYGLAPVSRIFESWIHSSQLTLGLFPEWFAEPQPDWPPQLHLTGFVLSDDGCAPEVSSTEQGRLTRFLDEGPAPIVFTPGSANRHAVAFFQTAVEAAALVRRRALLVTPYGEHLPRPLPSWAGHVSYAPFSRLFRQAAAVVHHGGIGTSAQVLAAGVPQLVMPMGFDQPDNAARLARLNVAEIVYPRHFTVPTVASALDRLFANDAVRTACEKRSAQMTPDIALGRCCDLLEEQFLAAGAKR